jgi:hypothetical protein
MFNMAVATFKIVVDKLVPVNDYHPAEVFVDSFIAGT